jgi:hypothetical protein
MFGEPVIEVGQTSSSSNNTNAPQVHIGIGADFLLMAAILMWALWDKVMKPTVTEKLDGVFAPVQEERKLNNILAQIGIITGASRVVLAAFHNGALDNAGYHLQKLSTVNSYTAPGQLPMAYPIRDLPIGRIMFELENLMKNPGWDCVIYAENLPQPCKDHLNKNDIQKMCNRLVRIGNLPIGIVSLQYSKSTMDKDTNCALNLVDKNYEPLLEDLYAQISVIMRRRIVHPSPIHKVFGRLLGTLKLNKD